MAKMNAIALYRKDHNLTQAELAKRLGIAQGTLSQIERGIRRFSHQKAAEIEKKTGGELRREALRPDIYGEIQ